MDLYSQLSPEPQDLSFRAMRRCNIMNSLVKNEKVIKGQGCRYSLVKFIVKTSDFQTSLPCLPHMIVVFAHDLFTLRKTQNITKSQIPVGYIMFDLYVLLVMKSLHSSAYEQPVILSYEMVKQNRTIIRLLVSVYHCGLIRRSSLCYLHCLRNTE